MAYTDSILVVDDTPVNLRVLTEMLKRHDFNVYSAPDGPTALEIVQSEALDLILLDIKMPGMDGYMVCEKIKADERFADIPVIFISALTDIDDIVKGFDTGGVDYITKPFKFREVLVRVETHLTLRRQRQQIEEMRERDRQYFESISALREQFIRTATHDLKNPLASIVGYTNILESFNETARDETISDAIVGLRYGSRKMRILVTDMLDLLQMESGLQLYYAPVEINKFVKDTFPEFNVLVKEKNINFSYVPLDMELQINIDPKWIGRVLSNLISNAIKYTPESGSVEIVLERKDDLVYLHVVDSGLGIPADDLDQIFDAFHRVRRKQHMQVEGTGLGLSIVRSIVEQHDGNIYVESELGKGSRFTVELPL